MANGRHMVLMITWPVKMVAYTVIYIKNPLVCNIMYLLHHIVHKMMMVTLYPALLSGC